MFQFQTPQMNYYVTGMDEILHECLANNKGLENQQENSSSGLRELLTLLTLQHIFIPFSKVFSMKFVHH